MDSMQQTRVSVLSKVPCHEGLSFIKGLREKTRKNNTSLGQELLDSGVVADLNPELMNSPREAVLLEFFWREIVEWKIT